ncbi:LCP family protein [Butyrivibrio sp. AE2032]|uniref:LCP family protein n=1 Tax=Butyrivibrio sp. AE2032 TaxID=1458463 RepID=UPI000550C78D|nr:LCP family protein [Butyrivibrio sp. AE2032]
MSNNDRGSAGNKTRKKSKALSYIVRFIAAVLGLAVGFFLYWVYLFGETFVDVPVMNQEDYSTIAIEDSGSTTGGDVSSSWFDGGHTRLYYDPSHPILEVKQKDPDIENILVFGIDARDSSDYTCRSDAMMVVSINRRDKCVKIISLMRDTGVYLGDTEETLGSRLNKLNSAYHYGGVGMMINTINVTFGLDIQRFVMFDFGSASSIIDLCGGVELDIKPEELSYANRYLDQMYLLDGNDSPHLERGGVQTLDGHQAVAWSRIRYLDSDFVRASRQRRVATALMAKVKDMSYARKLQLLNDSAGVFETNMRSVDIMRVALNCFDCMDNLEEHRIPDDGLYTVQNDPWMMKIDFAAQKKSLNEYIWGE